MNDAPNIHEPQPIPDVFLDGHYCQHHAMAALQIDEPTFWAAYVSGRIPRGVSLMALTGVPLIVWPKDVLDEWNRNGRQPEAGAIELENRVLHSLMDAYESVGVEFPTYDPVVGEELN